ncbi:Uncharacterised protein [Escherichia coli]|uniref:Transposase n=1 Tax=Escherichia coli TaxID=562 RepID=A0AB38GTN1_ECOLX|nr:Uncharacterised protein [Escherichia coli]
MKQFTVAAVNGGMIGHRCAKAAQQDIARLCRGQGHPVKARCLHIVQVQVLTVAPPLILTVKIRHLNPRQMVCIPEQGVTVRHPVFKAPSGQVRNAAEFVNVTPADQPPGQCAFYLQPPVSLAQPGQTTGTTVNQRHNLPLHLCPQPVFRGNTKYASGSAEIFTQGIYRSPSGVLTTKPHDSAGTHRRACARIADSVCVIGFTAKVC